MDVDLLFFFFLLVSSAGLSSSLAADDCAVSAAPKDTCVSDLSVALQEFYKNTSLQRRISSTPCNSNKTSPGVFWLEKSPNISTEQLITPHLRVGVPIKAGFFEFMKVDPVDSDGKTNATGFPIQVFEAAIATLPYKITREYFAFDGDRHAPGYYDRLVSQVHDNKYDAVVGDVTITVARSDIIEFTYPYMDAGVRLIVPTKSDDAVSPWWFMKPLTSDLWLATLAAAVLKGILVWFFEKDINPEFQGTPSELIGKILSFSISTFVFAHHERLESNYSRFIVNLWIFLVFILVTAFAANLTSMLTVDKIQPIITDLETLRVNGDNIGYQNGSFVFDLLQNEKIDASKLIAYSTVKEYADGLKRGSKNGGVSAIMDEIPYIRIFLKDHCRDYTMAGRTYRTGGFGFAFPRGSAMVPDISRAIMNFTEGDDMYKLETAWFGDQTTCPDAGSSVSNQSLPLYSLRSIYTMIGAASIMALIFYYFNRIYKRRRLLKFASNDSTTTLLQPNAATELINYHGVPLPTSEYSIQINQDQPQNGHDHDRAAVEKEASRVGCNDLSADPPRSPSKKRLAKSSSYS